MKTQQVNLYIFIIAFFIFFQSCDPNKVYEDNTKIPEGVWDRNNKISFNVEITDTISPYNLYINIRNTGMYQMSNIYLFVTAKFPENTIYVDTVECILADEKGKWLGSGLGDIIDNQIPYRKNIKFPKSGTYIFTYEQGMRTQKLPFIMDVGLRVEKVEK